MVVIPINDFVKSNHDEQYIPLRRSFGSHARRAFLFRCGGRGLRTGRNRRCRSCDLILAGWLVLPTRQKFGGATKGTSVASVMARSLFRYQLNRNVLPTVTLQSIKSFRIILTRKLSVFVGRAVPGVGWALLARDVFAIVHGTVSKYNSLVKHEDRVF
nr:hypothetical protein [Burkholderia ubonensis]